MKYVELGAIIFICIWGVVVCWILWHLPPITHYPWYVPAIDERFKVKKGGKHGRK